jgi:hypothetical protein
MAMVMMVMMVTMVTHCRDASCLCAHLEVEVTKLSGAPSDRGQHQRRAVMLLGGSTRCEVDDMSTYDEQDVHSSNEEAVKGLEGLPLPLGSLSIEGQPPRAYSNQSRSSSWCCRYVRLASIALLTVGTLLVVAAFIAGAFTHTKSNTSGSGSGSVAPVVLRITNATLHAREHFCERCFPQMCHSFELDLGLATNDDNSTHQCQLSTRSEYSKDDDNVVLTWSAGPVSVSNLVTACTPVEAFRDVVELSYPIGSTVSNSSWQAACHWS